MTMLKRASTTLALAAALGMGLAPLATSANADGYRHGGGHYSSSNYNRSYNNHGYRGGDHGYNHGNRGYRGNRYDGYRHGYRHDAYRHGYRHDGYRRSGISPGAVAVGAAAALVGLAIVSQANRPYYRGY